MTTYNPSSVLNAVRALFVQELRSNVSKWQSLKSRLTMTVKSDKKKETYAWAGPPPALRELPKDRETIYDAMSDASFDVTNKVYVGALMIQREDLDDDQTGMLRARIQQMVTRARNLEVKLAIAAITGGTSATDILGETFIQTGHAIRGQQTATQSNLLTGTGTTVAQIQTDVADAVEALMMVRDENAEPFDEEITDLVVIHPPQITRQMHEAIKGAFISSTDNAFYRGFRVEPFESARLGAVDANDYYVVNASSPLKPVILQERDPFEFSQQEEGSHDAFEREVYKYKVRWRGAAAVGAWQTIMKVTNT